MRSASGCIEADNVRMCGHGVVLVHVLGLDVQVAFDDAEEASLAVCGRVADAACRRNRSGTASAAVPARQQVGSASSTVA